MITKKDMIDCCKFLLFAVIVSYLLNGCASKPVQDAQSEPLQKAISCVVPSYPFHVLEVSAASYEATWHVFNDRSRGLIVEFHNALTNANIQPDKVGFFRLEGADSVLVVMLKNECVIEVVEAPIKLLYSLLNGKVI